MVEPYLSVQLSDEDWAFIYSESNLWNLAKAYQRPGKKRRSREGLPGYVCKVRTERNRFLSYLRRKGLTCREIGAIMGLTHQAVSNKVSSY